MSVQFSSSAIDSNWIRRVLSWLGLLVVLVVSWWLRARYVWVQPLDYDEGHWLMFGALVNAGYPAYTVTFVGIPPLALLTIQLGLALFGTTLAVRYPMTLFSLVGIATIYWSVRSERKDRSNRLTALVAAILLSFGAAYFQDSVSIMAEVPAVAMSILALALAQQYTSSRKLFWLALSGAAFALSLALKVFVVFLPVLIGGLLLISVLDLAGRSWPAVIRRLALAGGVWLLGCCVPLAIFLTVYDAQAMVQQVFVFRLALRQVWQQQTSLADNLVSVGQMWLALGPLVAGAGFGLVTGWRRHRVVVRLWSAWLLLATLVLVWHIPLRSRYVALLIPPLAVLSAVGVVQLMSWLSGRLKSGSQTNAKRGNQIFKSGADIMATVLLAGVVVGSLVSPIRLASLPRSPDTFPDLNLEAVQYVWRNSLPGDCLITDDQRLAFAAGRLVPPALSETSWARIATGWVTVEDIAAEIARNDCPMVVYADWRFDHHLPGLRTRLADFYFLELEFADKSVIFTGNKQVTRQPAIPAEARIGQTVVFKGIDLAPPASWQAGQEVWLAAYWMAGERLLRPYKIFVQLRNERDEVVASADHFPFPAPAGHYRLTPHLASWQDYAPQDVAIYPANGMLPAQVWPPGTTIREVTLLNLPEDLPAGTYYLYLGMYDPDTLERLEVVAEAGQADALRVTPIQIGAN